MIREPFVSVCEWFSFFLLGYSRLRQQNWSVYLRSDGERQSTPNEVDVRRQVAGARERDPAVILEGSDLQGQQWKRHHHPADTGVDPMTLNGSGLPSRPAAPPGHCFSDDPEIRCESQGMIEVGEGCASPMRQVAMSDNGRCASRTPYFLTFHGFRQGCGGSGGGEDRNGLGDSGGGGDGEDGRAILDWLSRRFKEVGCQGWATVLAACPATPVQLNRMRGVLSERWWAVARSAVRGGAR